MSFSDSEHHDSERNESRPLWAALFILGIVEVMGKIVVVNDLMQHGYTYERVAPAGKQFDPEFDPDLTPKEMLAMGIFDGVYMRDCTDEFPKSWFTHAKFAGRDPSPSLNYYGVHASQLLSVWERKGWIYPKDPRGWFQWYCRYYMGRRIPEEDARQIARWKGMRRHIAQLVKNCERGDPCCRPKQRQALLHWAYDARKY